MSLNSRGKDLVVFAALLGAAGWGTWLFLRMQLDLGSGWTDGTVRYDRLVDDRVRHAVWDEPVPLPATVNTTGSESSPALSPDGRLLVFTAGEAGLNADLFVSELSGGEPGEPRPLELLNTELDELAPAFGPDALYFATNRGGTAFGLDIWRAPYGDGVFGAPEPIGSGINTSADESDPYPVPGTRALLFASDRQRGARDDFDLYLASPDPGAGGGNAFVVSALDVLNTPFEEREPALTADGRTLIFASDRAGSAGDFDLYRSFLEDGEWLSPEPLLGINTAQAERGPLLSPDGFSLFFDATDAEGVRDLWRARSLELFRVPGPPLSLQEILLLIALFLIALLGWLSKRWRTLDVIYKCALISLLVHLILMWYLQEVYPEQGPTAVAGNERLFHVRLAPSASGAPAAARERSGELELVARSVAEPEAAPSRAETGVELAAAAPSRIELATPERALEAPARSDAQLSEHRSATLVEPALQEREAPLERLSENAPGLALQVNQTSAAPTAAEANEPNRAAMSAQPLAASPAAVHVEPAHAPAEAGRDDPGPVRLARADAPSLPGETAVAEPRESFEASRAEAPAMDLPEVTAIAAPRRAPGSAARQRTEPSSPTAELGEASPSPRTPADLAPTASPAALPARSELASSATMVARGDPEVDVRQVHETAPADVDARESPRFDATGELSQAQATRAVPAASDPSRFEVTPQRTARLDAQPAALDASGLVPRRAVGDAETAPSVDALRASLDPTPNGAPEVAVRGVEEALPGPAPEPLEPRRFDPTADLARREPERFRPRPDAEAAQPRRFEREPSVPAPAPARAPLAAVVPPPEPAPDDLPRRFEKTPYKNRFGQEKLRALEEFGGGAETERAVAAGLAYLASIQSRQGFWGERRDRHEKYGDVRVGKTGLALLAFLGAGHTPDSNTEYTPVVERALRFLLDVQDDPSGHFGDCSAYGHGIATYALAECFALTRDERLRPALEAALSHVLENQNHREDPRLFGGWGYYYRDGRVWNGDTWPRVSVTAWQVMALESSRLGGLEVPDRAFEEARQFVLGAWDPGHHAFRYSHDPERLRSGYPILPASTPAGLFALSLLGVDVARPELAEARAFILQRAPRDYRYTSDDAFVASARGNLYFWYYGTLAMFRVGGSEWERWNAAMKDTLLDGQDANGSWEPISIYSQYAGDDDDERTYSTAMCVLTLEVYYRYFTPLLEVR